MCRSNCEDRPITITCTHPSTSGKTSLAIPSFCNSILKVFTYAVKLDPQNTFTKEYTVAEAEIYSRIHNY